MMDENTTEYVRTNSHDFAVGQTFSVKFTLDQVRIFCYNFVQGLPIYVERGAWLVMLSQSAAFILVNLYTYTSFDNFFQFSFCQFYFSSVDTYPLLLPTLLARSLLFLHRLML